MAIRSRGGACRLAGLRVGCIAGLLTLVLFGAAAPPLGAEEIRGRIELVRGGGPARGADVREAVVYFEPTTSRGEAAGASGARPRARDARDLLYVMTTRDKEFLPRVLPIPVGGRVQFANDDPILHNVFSVSNGKPFDLGFLRKGPGREHRFDTAGLVRIYCNVHHSMVAYVLVVDTPYFTQPAADGSFALANLPKGAGRLTVWHEQTDPWTTSLSLAGGSSTAATAPLDARLEITHPQVPPHLDKNGKSYFTSGRDQYRH